MCGGVRLKAEHASIVFDMVDIVQPYTVGPSRHQSLYEGELQQSNPASGIEAEKWPFLAVGMD
jgi:hypothetical protein